jgi:hypothetical protein
MSSGLAHGSKIVRQCVRSKWGGQRSEAAVHHGPSRVRNAGLPQEVDQNHRTPRIAPNLTSGESQRIVVHLRDIVTRRSNRALVGEMVSSLQLLSQRQRIDHQASPCAGSFLGASTLSNLTRPIDQLP